MKTVKTEWNRNPNNSNTRNMRSKLFYKSAYAPAKVESYVPRNGPGQ